MAEISERGTQEEEKTENREDLQSYQHALIACFRSSANKPALLSRSASPGASAGLARCVPPPLVLLALQKLSFFPCLFGEFLGHS